MSCVAAYLFRMRAKRPASTAASSDVTSSSSRAAWPAASSSTVACTARGPTASSTRRHASCKQRAAELKDEKMYSQGHERPEGDFCPICTLPIPLPMSYHSSFNACCMKRICKGCDLAARKRGMKDCLFCRTPSPDNDVDKLAMIRARVEKKDPAAIKLLGDLYYHGSLGLQKNMRRAMELWTEAAELGSIEALYHLGDAHFFGGEGVEVNKEKGADFYTKAAMQGHVQSRHNLGCYEGEKGNGDRAVRHLLISAKVGDKISLETVKRAFMEGLATKEQYAEALKGYQDAKEEMKSHDRDKAREVKKILARMES
ncbi:hypothetical protein THAOC_35500 [Thalassiosira oceanica]|uniref:RING-type domain-containing protein n=1 Tax=Thalassiosira oceanica TaxID=159749 RepID=K0R0T5_THAOC|nr:hypothetical protein THAOC_35500 [Thalassiosira oceanica]|eukprot:EJK45863.1 hypothetical protein THAOC_35500 [Thalassiosira oceanica]